MTELFSKQWFHFFVANKYISFYLFFTFFYWRSPAADMKFFTPPPAGLSWVCCILLEQAVKKGMSEFVPPIPALYDTTLLSQL